MSIEYCHHCSSYIDTDFNVEGEYTESVDGIDYKCEGCIESEEANQ